MTDQLEVMFRTLRESPEPPGLDASADVRRRGDKRRRMARIGSAAIATVVGVVVVVGISEALPSTDNGAPEPATSTPGPEPSTTLASDPLLEADELEAVGIYQSYPFTEGIDDDQQLAISCLGAPSSWGAEDVRRTQFISNHIGLGIEHARLVETVATFSTAVAAQGVADRLHAADGCPGLGAGAAANQVISQRGELQTEPGGSRLGQLDQGASTDLYYHELAFSRVGEVLVVLEWSSAGLPRTGSATDGWEWAISDEQMRVALTRAVQVVQ